VAHTYTLQVVSKSTKVHLARWRVKGCKCVFPMWRSEKLAPTQILHNPASLQGPSENFKVDTYSMFEMARNLTWYGDKRVRETCE